ncbi:MAG: hypothetical protein KDD82_30880, partial [Planctomycetes bacterium]|nr:hypothetical protein [Planctomycetota bacterium]
VYGTERGDGNLLDGFAAAWARGESLSAADDQRMTPIHVEEVVREVLARVGSAGLVHVSGREAASRWELAERLRVALGHPPERLTRIQLGTLFPGRPLDTRLTSDVSPRWTLAAGIEAVAANYRAPA